MLSRPGVSPRVYCFSIKRTPREIWQKCAQLSGGAIRMNPWMTAKNGKPPADDNLKQEVDKIRLREKVKVR